jgi:Glutaredoxin
MTLPMHWLQSRKYIFKDVLNGSLCVTQRPLCLKMSNKLSAEYAVFRRVIKFVLIRTFLVLCILLPGKNVWAEVYKYMDEAGNIYFVENLSAVPSRYRNQVTRVPPPVPIDPRHSRHTQSQENAQQPKSEEGTPVINLDKQTLKRLKDDILFFVSSNCADCAKMEKFLKTNRIKYRKLDIENSEKAFQAYDKLGGGVLPLTSVAGRVIHGYSPQSVVSAIESLAKKKS